MSATYEEADAKLEWLSNRHFLGWTQGEPWAGLLNRSVLVVEDCGSIAFFRSAFVVKYKDWYLVITEHQGNHKYYMYDCAVYQYAPLAVSDLGDQALPPTLGENVELFKK